MISTLLFFTLSLTVPSAHGSQAPWPSSVEFGEASDDSITFQVPEGQTPPPPVALGNLGSPFHEVHPMGFLHSQETSLPYVIFSALPCDGCKNKKKVFIVRADGTRLSEFVYPGRITDPKNGTTLLDATAYYGSCLAGKGDVYVVFQRERVDRRGMRTSVFLAEATPSRLEEKLIITQRHRPSRSQVLARARGKTCWKIKGFNRNMASKRPPRRPQKKK